MKFNEKQEQAVNEFIMKYNSDEEFRNEVQDLYDNEIGRLAILQIYALEELLRYGNKGMFKRFLESKGESTEEEAVELVDGFRKLLDEDPSFKQYKMEQLKKYPDTLSDLEMFAFTLISRSQSEKVKMHKELTDELEYDPINPILFSTDYEIRETLENLLIGEFIHKLLELPAMKPAKVRQKEEGMIASVDKKDIIEQVRSVVCTPNSMCQFKSVIDNRYVEVKFALLAGKGASAFDQYIKFNTNISINEVFEIEKDDTADKMYEFIKNMVNKRKGPRQ